MENIEYQNDEGKPIQRFKKSRELITAKYNSTKLESSIFSIGLKNIQEVNGELISKTTAQEIMKLTGTNANKVHAFYDQLKETAVRMQQRIILIEDKENDRFRTSNLITDTLYENGEFTIKYNKTFKNMLINLDDRYTTLDINILCSFSSVTAQRLYENLKSLCYVPKDLKGHATDKIYTISYNVSELKILLNAVDTNNDKIAGLFYKVGTETDYDYILDRIREIAADEKDPIIKKRITPKWEDWRDFRKVLLNAIDEINKTTEMNVTMETERSKKGGKINKVTFIVSFIEAETMEEIVSRKSKVAEKKVELTAEEMMQKLSEADEILESSFTMKDMKEICLTADYDLEKIKKYYNLLKKQKNDIDNPTGWMINAIRNQYSEPKKKKNVADDWAGANSRGNYDFDELERLIRIK